jgi:hypothetical protein
MLRRKLSAEHQNSIQLFKTKKLFEEIANELEEVSEILPEHKNTPIGLGYYICIFG